MSDKIGILSCYSTDVISAMGNLKITRGGLGSYYTTWIGWHPTPTSNRMALP